MRLGLFHVTPGFGIIIINYNPEAIQLVLNNYISNNEIKYLLLDLFQIVMDIHRDIQKEELKTG